MSWKENLVPFRPHPHTRQDERLGGNLLGCDLLLKPCRQKGGADHLRTGLQYHAAAGQKKKGVHHPFGRRWWLSAHQVVA